MREDFELSRSEIGENASRFRIDQGTGFAAPGGEFTELFMNGPSLRMENF